MPFDKVTAMMIAELRENGMDALDAVTYACGVRDARRGQSGTRKNVTRECTGDIGPVTDV